MPRFRLVLAAVVLAGARNAAGQEPTPMSLAQAREVAPRAAPDVVLAELRADLARKGIDVAGALANPTLGLQTARLTAKLTATLGYPLPLFGQRGVGIAAARADAAVAELDIDAVRVDARWNATRAWLDLWEAQEKAQLLQAAATEADRLATIARERFAAGSAPRVDVIRTTADSARARAEADAAARAVSGFAARLAARLGPDTPLSIRATGPIDVGPLPAESEAISHLLVQHPALRRDRAQIEAAAAHVRTEQRSRWPLMNTDLTVAQGDPTLPGTDVLVGISFEVPVLNRRSGAIDRARANEVLAQATAEADLRRLAADLIAAYRESEGAAVRARALTDAVLPGLTEARQMTEDGYRDGRVDLLRVLEAEAAVREARLAQVEARASWQRALADVERDIGVAGDQRTAGAP